MSAQEKLAGIIAALENGKTVHVVTQTRITEVTPKTFKKWAVSGHALFKATDKSLFIASGKKFACIDYCSIRFV